MPAGGNATATAVPAASGAAGSASSSSTGSIASPQQVAPADASMQVAPPSVTLPTPPLPEPTPLPTPLPEASPTPQASAASLQPAQAEFNPPSAKSLNLPSAQPPGNPAFAPASAAMPIMASDSSPGVLGDFFDWAKKLRFQVAVRSGYDSNVNSVHTNVVGSMYGNINAGVNYRFGDPRLTVDASLTGGLTAYPNLPNNNALQGQAGLGLNVEYRYQPRLVFTFNTSTSYQTQPNAAATGSTLTGNNPYIYSANSLAASYQISNLWTSVTRLNFISNYYLQNNNGLNNNQQGFTDTGFTQSFRYLYKPSTTLVVDYSSDYYAYSLSNYNSWVQTLDVGFDHIFNPKLFWNLRLGAQLIASQNNTQGGGASVGPYLDNTFKWAFGEKSSLSWITHLGTQPSGQMNVSYSESLSSGLNYTQGLFSKLKFDAGLFYLLSNYKDAPLGLNGAPITYDQNYIQANVDLSYQLNRIIDISVGYQYLTSSSPAVPSQEYNRGISYVQIRGGF